MITFSDQLDKIAPALLAARSAMKPAHKSGHNKFDRYTYSNEEDWSNAIQPHLLANGIVLIASGGEASQLPDRTTKAGGTEHVTQTHGEACLLHSSGQWIKATCSGQGQDRADKGLYKATTGMLKDMYAMMLSLPKTDDPEADESVGLTPPPATGKPPKPKPDATPAVDFTSLAIATADIQAAGKIDDVVKWLDKFRKKLSAAELDKLHDTAGLRIHELCRRMADELPTTEEVAARQADVMALFAGKLLWLSDKQTEINTLFETRKRALDRPTDPPA